MAKTTAKKGSSGGKKTGSGKAKGKVGKRGPAGRGSGYRELIAPNGDKRYVRRDGLGQFRESVEVGRSLSADRRSKSKTIAKKGHGDEGDERR